MQDDVMFQALLALTREYRATRRAMLDARRKYTPLEREALEAIRARHPRDVDIDTLLLDVIFLHDALDEALDKDNETLDLLHAAQRENAQLRREIHRLNNVLAMSPDGGTAWL